MNFQTDTIPHKFRNKDLRYGGAQGTLSNNTVQILESQNDVINNYYTNQITQKLIRNGIVLKLDGKKNIMFCNRQLETDEELVILTYRYVHKGKTIHGKKLYNAGKTTKLPEYSKYCFNSFRWRLADIFYTKQEYQNDNVKKGFRQMNIHQNTGGFGYIRLTENFGYNDDGRYLFTGDGSIVASSNKVILDAKKSGSKVKTGFCFTKYAIAIIKRYNRNHTGSNENYGKFEILNIAPFKVSQRKLSYNEKVQQNIDTAQTVYVKTVNIL